MLLSVSVAVINRSMWRTTSDSWTGRNTGRGRSANRSITFHELHQTKAASLDRIYRIDNLARRLARSIAAIRRTPQQGIQAFRRGTQWA